MIVSDLSINLKIWWLDAELGIDLLKNLSYIVLAPVYLFIYLLSSDNKNRKSDSFEPIEKFESHWFSTVECMHFLFISNIYASLHEHCLNKELFSRRTALCHHHATVSSTWGWIIDLDTSPTKMSLSVLYLAHPHFKWFHRVITLVSLQQIIKQPCLLVFLVQRRNASLSAGSYAHMVQSGSYAQMIFVYIVLIKEIKKKIWNVSPWWSARLILFGIINCKPMNVKPWQKNKVQNLPQKLCLKSLKSCQC